MAIVTEAQNPTGDPVDTGLSQVERVVDAYVAPTKTFLDIRRNASWWLPFVLGIVVSLLFVYSVDRQIGFDQVAQANIDRSASGQQRMSAMPEAQRAQMMHTIATSTRVISYVFPLLGLIFALIAAAILMASFNFGLGGHATFPQYLAVWFYAGLPLLIKYILAAIAIFAGASAAQFDMNNPVGTNIGWYLGSDVPLWLRTLGCIYNLGGGAAGGGLRHGCAGKTQQRGVHRGGMVAADDCRRHRDGGSPRLADRIEKVERADE